MLLKKGDVVKHAVAHPRDGIIGIVLSVVSFERQTVNQDNAYRVMWRDGTIATAWDYDLVKLT